MIKKVVIGMSGGVDSSVSAYLLKKEGYEVIGVTLNQHLEEFSKDIEDAKNVCDKLGIIHEVINIREHFENIVIKYFLDGYKAGITPSPCVICDDEIKFKILFDIAEKYKADFVATGHYSSVEYSEKFSEYLLKSVHSIIKDQSYMLYRLSPEKLKRLIFPLKDYSKQEIRKIALNIGLEVFDKKDSQGVCFAKEGYKKFLQDNLKNEIKVGNYIDKNGNILGQHEGYQLYTIGQRRGLGINLSRPIFITEIKPKTNEIVLGEFDELFTDTIEIKNFKLSVDYKKLEDLELLARPRFSSSGFYGKLLFENDKLFFKYNNKNAHNAKGQHVVFFYDNFVVGGGEIA